MPGCFSRLCLRTSGRLRAACQRGFISDVYASPQGSISTVADQIAKTPGELERNLTLSFKPSSNTLKQTSIVPEKFAWHSRLPLSCSDRGVGSVLPFAGQGILYPFASSTSLRTENFTFRVHYSVAHRPGKAGSKSRVQSDRNTRLQPRGTGSTRRSSQTGKTRLKVLQKTDRKRAFPSSLSPSKSRHVTGVKERGKRRLASSLKPESNDDGERIKRRRKRIKAHPRDITFKRGLDPDTSSISLPVSASGEKAKEDKPLSQNAKFRQIEPSRELLRQIEENLLGRRRLLEWRRAGFDPTRTSPLDDVPGSKDSRAQIQETVFRQKLTFIAAAKIASSLPPTRYTEIAFAGRSNVGKSSLINSLTRQWHVARTSDKPGLTQTINFFTLGNQLCLVDLPGYGFAFAKDQVKENWEELVQEYVTSRPNLKRVCLLVDAKWGLKPRDQQLIQLMESSRTRYQIILTKTDLLPPLDLARRATQILQILKDHRSLIQPLIMVSSKSGAGLSHLRASLARVVSGDSQVFRGGFILATSCGPLRTDTLMVFP
ncbi:hypothetical protein R1sor_020269 [Riccia sorocarpa]|uniref:EngB-type G domain-containing protein n=1 Tax=Riccia sorocarpa TaxID=122646 RepID=A0ABD3IHN0_9MARC